jgi:copper oxidase (laccase) domain-containing protein
VGLTHAGWKGTVLRAALATVQAMKEEFNSEPGNILAAIGPSIGAHHYEVGEDVVEQVRHSFGQDASALLPTRQWDHQSGVQFDLWAANRLVLEQAGVREIEVAGICTACNLDDWYSHRGENGLTGRFGALLALNG